jgi:hypothetical protein
VPSDPKLPHGEFSKSDLDHLERVLAKPVDEPHGHQQIEVDQKFEAIGASPNRLSDDYEWVILGLAYCLIKIDRSLMEAYQYSLGKSVALKTYQAPHPLIDVNGSSEWRLNPWSGIIQGLERDRIQGFVDYVRSYRFHRTDTGHQWFCRFEQVVLADPFSQEPAKHNVWLALPTNLSLRRFMHVMTPGLGQHAPLIGMASYKVPVGDLSLHSWPPGV